MKLTQYLMLEGSLYATDGTVGRLGEGVIEGGTGAGPGGTALTGAAMGAGSSP